LNGAVRNEESLPLPGAVKVGWAIGESAIACHMAIISVYLLFYLTEVHHFPGALAGTLILIPRVWNLVTDPLMGGISDRVKSRWGRRRPFLLAGAVVWALSYVAMFWMPIELTLAQKTVWFLVTYLGVNTGLSLYHVPYSAMVAEMTRSTEERLTLLSCKEIAARASVLLTVMASPLIVSAAPSPLIGHHRIGLAAGCLILLSGLVAFVATASAPVVSFRPQTLSWSEQVRAFRRNKGLFRLSGVYFFSSAADAFYSAMLIYFITVTLQVSGSLMGTLYPLGSLTAILMTSVWAGIGRRVGRRKACAIAFAGAGATFLLATVLPVGTYIPMLPFMVLLGAFFAGLFLLPGTMVPDTVEEDERFSGQRREGTIYGAWILTQQTGMALGAFLVGVYLDLIGYKSGSGHIPAGHEAILLRAGFALGPALLIGLGLWLLKTVPLGGRVHAGQSLESGKLATYHPTPP
jgi:glycoside/pentoside/hexuronide:cation symporter, GPH family